MGREIRRGALKRRSTKGGERGTGEQWSKWTLKAEEGYLRVGGQQERGQDRGVGQGEQGQNIMSCKFADVTTKGWRLRTLTDLQTTQVSDPTTHIVAHNWL